MVGSLGNIYESVEKLRDCYIQPNQEKAFLLSPRPPVDTRIPILLSDDELMARGIYKCSTCDSKIKVLLSDHELINRKLFLCPDYHNVASVPNIKCPDCEKEMSIEIPYVSAVSADKGTSVERGFVKGLTYMVMDDLEVMPMSTTTCVTVLNKFQVKDLRGVEERFVDFGLDEGLKLLQASLECKTVLTSVFLGNEES
ncbi:uncharacterized protein LOC116112245 [Pistacia vera]|uniref:uncharacterized protein LOC116112245 n=1 Tax=Pistacia vera TaxID=55513 RepID=UPI00126372C0|nr:uncharacterized protein LOC116112245 [Pistacia vera]